MKKRFRKKKGLPVKENKQHQTTGTGEHAPVDEELTEAAQTDAETATPDSGADDESREAQLEAELAAWNDRYLRLYSQFEEYKKQMKKEQDKLAKYAGEEIFKGILPSLDNLELAVGQGIDGSKDATQQLTGLLEGVCLTLKGLQATLERFGVTPIDAIGCPYNAEEQEAMTMQASNEVPSGYVVAEYKRGYRYKDRLLRPAQVVVSSGPAS